MKNLIFTFIIYFPLFTFSQEYSEVIEVSGKNTDQLYVSARQWFAKTFVSSNDVLQMDDAVAGKLIGKGGTVITESYMAPGIMKIPVIINFKIEFTISVSARDGRYKCDINNLQVTPVAPDSPYLQVTSSFEDFLKYKEYYKNGSDIDWLIANGDQEGNKITRQIAKYYAPTNAAYYSMINKTDEKIKELMLSLQEAMKATEADW